MNNEQFRRLVLDQPGKKTSTALDKDAQTANKSQTQSLSSPSSSTLLGSRMRSSIPMTPRHVRGSANNNTNEFARQLAEQRREEQQPPAKRFKASAAPKGTKFASGYQDRTALRRQQQQDDDDDGGDSQGTGNGKEESVKQRLKALEDMVKLGQIDQQTFEKLRKEIGVGGDLESTHLVKGLDWDLLKRAKAGEDLSQKKEEEVEKKEIIDGGDVDEELDRVLEEKEDGIAPASKEKKVKKGNLAMAPPAGKLSRDEILKQLKASRAAATASTQPEPPESTLSNKFKKIDKSEKKRWIETDPNTGRRKEILVITDAEGNSKRKVRWLDKEQQPVAPKVDNNGLLIPGQDSTPLGMEVPAVVAARIAAEKAAEEEADDGDIFAGVGADYNPLGDLDEDDDDDDSEVGEKEEKADTADMKEEEHIATATATEPSTQPRRNYFKDSRTDKEPAEDEPRTNPLTSDPTLLAAFKRAAALRKSSAPGNEEEDDDRVVDMEGDEFADNDDDPERLARRKKFLEEARRRDALDALDLDYGFGSSRIEDEEDEEGPTYGDGQQRGNNKRKRGPKKRKGDKDSATDVLRVMGGRKNS